MGELQKTVDYTPFINAYLEQKDVGTNSKKTYRGALQQFFRWCTQEGLTNLTKRDVLQYKEELRIQGKSAYTISLYLTSVRCFFEWAEEEGIGKNIARSVKGEKIGRGFKKEALTREQALDLLEGTDKVRDRAVITLMVATGLRCIEVCRSNVEDLRNKGDKTVLYIQGKGHTDKDDFVILEHPVLVELQSYLSTRKALPEEPLFTSEARNTRGARLHPGSISRIVKKALRAVKIDSPLFTAHSLRHTAVTFCLLGGAAIEEAQMLARHSNINTTMIYSHHIDRMKANPESKVMAYMGAS